MSSSDKMLSRRASAQLHTVHTEVFAFMLPSRQCHQDHQSSGDKQLLGPLKESEDGKLRDHLQNRSSGIHGLKFGSGSGVPRRGCKTLELIVKSH